MILGKLTASLLGSVLAGYSLTNFEIQKYYQNEPKFNGVCSGNYLPKVTLFT